MKLGSRYSLAGKPFEVVSMRANGGIVMRPVKKPGERSNGVRYSLGESVRIVGVDLETELRGEVISLEPLKARVTSPGIWCGLVVSGGKMRKQK